MTSFESVIRHYISEMEFGYAVLRVMDEQSPLWLPHRRRVKKDGVWYRWQP